MPAKKPTPEAMPARELVLAAIERAERHRRKRDPTLYRRRPVRTGVARSVVKEHLGLTPGAGSTIRLRPTWNELHAAGLIEKGRALGMEEWKLTDAGKRHLDRARQAGDLEPLPESPQHRQWREARAIAAEHTAEFGERLRQVMTDATGLLNAHESADSDAWEAIGRRLKEACKRMESASYCLLEWAEPDDSQADPTPPRKLGLRSIKTFLND